MVTCSATKKTTSVKRNLIVFIHPTILRGGSNDLAIMGDKYNYIRNQQLALRERGIHLMPDDASPLLPKWDDYLALPPPFADDTKTPLEPLDDSASY